MQKNRELFNYIIKNAQVLSEKILALQYQYQPELKKQYTALEHNKCIKDIIFHLQHLAQSLLVENPLLFGDYVIWAKVLLNNLKIPTEHLYVNLICIKEILQEILPQQSTMINACIDSAIESLLSSSIEVPSFISNDNPHADLARQYLQLLLDGDKHKASSTILNASDTTLSVKDIYMYIFEPVLKEVGRLWQTHKITVAQEHYCTAITQLIMAQLYGKIFTTQKIGLSLVAGCVNEELHEVGIRMIADILELEGWDTYYLGANVPMYDIIEFVSEKNPNIVALSCTMTFHLHKVIDIINEIKNITKLNEAKIMVGGYPFNIDKNLWKKIGADLYASNALETCQLVSESF